MRGICVYFEKCIWGCFLCCFQVQLFKSCLHLFHCYTVCLSTLKIQNVFVQVEYSVCICASILNTGRGSVIAVPGSDVIINYLALPVPPTHLASICLHFSGLKQVNLLSLSIESCRLNSTMRRSIKTSATLRKR